MRPAEVTDEQIIEAGKQLIAAGRRVTGFGIRQITKSGHTKRLKKVWDDYQNSESDSSIESLPELPVEMGVMVSQITCALTDKINKIAIELNDKAVKASETRVAVLVRDTNEIREQVEQELVDANVTVNNLELELEKQETAIELLKTKLAEANQFTQSQAVEIAQLSEKLIAAERNTKNEAEYSSYQITTLTNEKQKLLVQQQTLYGEIDALKVDLADKKDEIKELRIDIQSLNDKNNTLGSQIVVFKSELVEKNTVMEYQKTEIEKLNQQVIDSTGALQELEVQAGSLRESLAKVTGKFELATTQNLALLQAIESKRRADGESQSNEAAVIGAVNENIQ